MVKLQAAARLKAAEVQAGYTGTKVSDLAQYLKTLNPNVKFQKMTGIPNSGRLSGAGQMGAFRIPASEGRALAQSLVDDGWYGRKVVKTKGKDRSSGQMKILDTPIEYMAYYCKNEELKNTPVITMYKPYEGFMRIMVQQSTNQSRTSDWNTLRMNSPYKFGKSRY